MLNKLKQEIIVQDKRKRERRTKCDPRYRNPNYPEFEERRLGRDRRCTDECEDHSLLNRFSGHRRVGAVIGAIVIGILLYLFLLGLYHLKRGDF